MADDVMFDLLHTEIVNRLLIAEHADDQDTGMSKLEALGFRVGQSMAERITKETPRFKDELDTMKFICKEFWMALYKKQIDNLRTNHQARKFKVVAKNPEEEIINRETSEAYGRMGVFVLQDNRFRLLTQMSNSKQYMDLAPKYLAFPCGLIRGALANLGVLSVVTAEVSTMPACKFQIQIPRM